MKHYFGYPLITLLLMTLVACSSDENSDDGSGNTTDVAVTGRVIETGMTYAQAEGYVNLDKLTSGYESAEIGIGVKSADSDREQYFKTQGVEGRKISVTLSSLNPATTYAFRTYVRIGSIYQYGEQKTFTTKEGHGIASTGTAKDIALFSAKLTADVNWEGLGEKESINVVIGYSQNRDELTTGESIVKYNYYTYDYYFRQGTEERGIFISNNRNALMEQDVTQLAAGSHYYYCAFTMLGSKVFPSDVKEFSTPNATKYIITGGVSDIKQSTAMVDARFNLAELYTSSNGNFAYSVIFATSPENLADENKRTETVTEGGKVVLFPLLPNATYYYQTKAQIGDSHVAYGETKTFKTQDLQQSGAVDLGLSCKWAACNLDATAPTELGNRYAWGETETKTDFDKYTYTVDFYNQNSPNFVPSRDLSGSSHDAATVNLGEPWRMPKKEEAEELIQNCSYIFDKYKDTYGYFYLSENGNALFIPEQSYWTSTPAWINVSYAWPPDGAYELHGKNIARFSLYNGLYIRPVQ